MENVCQLQTEEDWKELFEELCIYPDDIKFVSDGSYGYIILLTTNIEEEQQKILELLNFEKAYSDLWILNIQGGGFFIPYTKYREMIKKTQGILWKKLIELRGELHSLFPPTKESQTISCRWKEKICTSKDELSLFIADVWKLIVEPLKNYKHLFNKEIPRKIDVLRHWFVGHDKELDKIRDFKKEEKRKNRVIKSFIGKCLLTYEKDYIILQISILKKLCNFLEEVPNYSQ